MGEASYWITPLALLPGVALLVMSTAIRFGQLHEEMHRRQSHPHGSGDHLFRRARLLRNALVALYGSAGLLAIAGLVGGVAELWMERAAAPVLSIAALAVACVAYAAVTLIRESILLGEIITEHQDNAGQEAP